MAQRPVVNVATQGAVGFTQAVMDQRNSTWLLSDAGAPTNGAAGTGSTFAGIGSLYIDVTNGVLYINTGTKASPTWTIVGTQS